ncbi:GNAT family N-acetyltransferase [Sphingomonas sp.]|uniref:GNAT family N-acetyltransferase n=1 Tax=Sphingomonas sp. TaxID=28214 RepID=UPI00286AD7FF|nr:GNAT family N-acetyltransferase [Sphingomonas sp.]
MTDEPPQIRPATDVDLDALHALVERAYRGDSARRGWSHEADLLDGQRTDRESLADTIRDSRQLLLVMLEKRALIASVTLTDKGSGIAYLGMLAVDPTLQATGIGRTMLAEAEAIARDQMGIATMEMTVIASRAELVSWYQRRGYVLTGERRPFPATDPRFGLPKRDNLEFVVLAKSLA